jgi:hypothetical protein
MNYTTLLLVTFLPVHPNTAPSAKQLRKLPGVEKVETVGPKRAARIIHVLNWHFVPEELFALDVQHESGGKLSKDEVSKLYDQHLKDVDVLQREQMQLLRALIRDHGLKTVFVEGVTDTSILLFEARVAAFRELRKELKEPLPKKAQQLLLELGAAAARLMI